MMVSLIELFDTLALWKYSRNYWTEV